MSNNLRLSPNENPATAADYPWCLQKQGDCVALFKKKSLAKDYLDAQSTSRRMQDDASRYRAMYLGAASYRRAAQ